MGALGVKVYASSGSMKETVVSGENVIAINIIGSHALAWMDESPNLGRLSRRTTHRPSRVSR